MLPVRPHSQLDHHGVTAISTAIEGAAKGIGRKAGGTSPVTGSIANALQDLPDSGCLVSGAKEDYPRQYPETRS